MEPGAIKFFLWQGRPQCYYLHNMYSNTGLALLVTGINIYETNATFVFQ